MEYAMKLLYQSNYWYNDGLKRARIRDLSGAAVALKKSLQYNRENIAARNLLGLVYYGRGEVGEALVEWIISKNLRAHENIASYYIKRLQESPSELEVVNQAIRKYNQGLIYCRQNGEDLAIIQLKKVVAAHPPFLKAQQLLALLYLHTEQYSRARQVLREAHKLDTTNEITLKYMHEMNQLRNKRASSGKREEKPQTVTYNIGNETIIQPASASVKEHSGMMTVINIAIGIIVGVAVMWFLIMPAVTRSTTEKTNRQTVEFSDKIAEQEAQISALKKELDGYRANSQESADVQETAASTMESYETVLSIYSHFTVQDMGDAAMVEELLKVNPNALGVMGRQFYDEMKDSVFGRYSSDVYESAVQNFSAENYSDAISNLTLLMRMDEGYDGGQAMSLLAKSYEASGDGENAKVWMDKVKDKYPDLADAGSSQEQGDQDTEE